MLPLLLSLVLLLLLLLLLPGLGEEPASLQGPASDHKEEAGVIPVGQSRPIAYIRLMSAA
jgi:hypothetical protein